MSSTIKRRDGFDGERLISVPEKVWKYNLKKTPAVFNLYITHIGYFPKATFHYRERRKGCEDNILIYCISGKGHYIVGDKKFDVKPNEYFLLPATDKYIKYWADSEDPWTIYWVHFTGAILDGFNSSLAINILKGPVHIPFNEKALEIWKNIYESLEMGYSTDNLCNTSLCLYHLIAAFLFPDKHIQPGKDESVDVINASILHMKANLRQKLTVEDMAVKNNLSVSHFSSLFKKATGMPPIDYFIYLKMQKACQLLSSHGAKIKNVALDLGYDDQYYFSRVFKKCMGTSPQNYKFTASKSLI
jgi:AraC-like DNA-binding protein